ncbi:MAG: ABC transporter permease [Nitrososphaerota archaeon]|nr:ABC transporter permease [Nitrososphaerota archaeon]
MELLALVRHLSKRGTLIIISTIIAVYLTVIIANIGGYVDQIIKSELYTMISMSLRQNPAYKHLNETQFRRLVDEVYNNELKSLGFDKPFVYRSFKYWIDALSLDLGRALFISSGGGSKSVRIIIAERLPSTVLLFTTINLLIFFTGLFGGLFLSRKYGSLLDKITTMLVPLSSLPGWFYGIFLILIFASFFRSLFGFGLPYGGMVSVPPPSDPIEYTIDVLKHMILPVLSWQVALSFYYIYQRRTFFLMFSSEDYIDLAKAKGLPESFIQRRYVLRPVLPYIITDFSLMLISSWMGGIITETVFSWPGIGLLLYTAINVFDGPVVIGIVVIYAYLLALTIFILEFIYGILDPRIRSEGGEIGVT